MDFEMSDRLKELAADIARQRQIIADLEREGHPTLGARTLLCLLEDEERELVRRLSFDA